MDTETAAPTSRAFKCVSQVTKTSDRNGARTCAAIQAHGGKRCNDAPTCGLSDAATTDRRARSDFLAACVRPLQPQLTGRASAAPPASGDHEEIEKRQVMLCAGIDLMAQIARRDSRLGGASLMRPSPSLVSGV